MDTAWPLFVAALALAALATLLALLGFGSPPMLVGAVVAAAGSYVCLRRSHRELSRRAYARVGVERNPDGTVGREGRAARRSRSADIDYEPRDWDDPDDWPFDDPFWTGTDEEDDPPGPEEGPGEWWERRTGRTPSRDGGAQVVAPREREACDVLGVDHDADAETVTAAYRERVLETHPDHGGDEESFKRVRWAYEYLKEHRE
ncbi:J domain-containing protein [Halosegnis marinus]|uniref:J domain-containing protein n=1 Tax=Halosegnis marinus TaxID=3034023 RepID=A0ABD5ZMI7_9EURY|nr:DnaJ domain-containing protein [Halosegnis sp. DT85]